MDVQIVLPPVNHDALYGHLCSLTELIDNLDPERTAHGALGGSYGYGAHWDSPVFLMRPYCWCERGDCRWCSEEACGCPHPEVRIFIDNEEVSSEEFWRWNRSLLGRSPHDVAKYDTPEYRAYSAEWDKRVKERDRRSRFLASTRTHSFALSSLPHVFCMSAKSEMGWVNTPWVVALV